MLTLPPYEGRERIIHIHENVHCTILFWAVKFSGFLFAKTSVNKRLLCHCKGEIAQDWSIDIE
jgi:hypothetical protein